MRQAFWTSEHCSAAHLRRSTRNRPVVLIFLLQCRGGEARDIQDMGTQQSACL